MSNSITTHQNSIKVINRFDFNAHREFREQVSKALEHINSEIIVDFSQTSYLDSAALGMLLIAKEHAKQKNKTIVLQAPRNTVAKVLEIANFNQLFAIRP